MSELTIYSPSADEQRLIARAQRLLAGLSEPRTARRAVAQGYDADEHAEGWRLLRLASGDQRSFAHLLAVANATTVSESAAVQARYAALDVFENRWFPRARNAIRRFVDPAHVAEVEATFFDDLAQQPLGPGVVASVGRFLERVTGLAESDAPGAAAAWQSLQKKGLTPDTLDATRALVAEAARFTSTGPDAALVAAVEAENAAQVEALERLTLWFNDWAEVFKGAFGYHDLVRLGITKRRGGRPRGGATSPFEGDADS